MQSNRLTPQFVKQMNDYWENASQIASTPIYLYDNPLFKELTPTTETGVSSRKQSPYWINYSLLKLAKPTH